MGLHPMQGLTATERRGAWSNKKKKHKKIKTYWESV